MRHSNAPMLQRMASPCLFWFRQSSQPQPLRAICRPHHHATCRASTAPNHLHLPLHAGPKLQSARLHYTQCVQGCTPRTIHIVASPASAVGIGQMRWAWGRMRGRIAALRAVQKSVCWIDTGSWFCFLRLLWLRTSRRVVVLDVPKEY